MLDTGFKALGLILFFFWCSVYAMGDESEVTHGVEASESEVIESVDNSSSLEELSLQPALPPEGFEFRLRPEGQSRFAWHARKEAMTVLALGGVYLGSWVAQKTLSKYVDISIPMLLTSVGVGLDYMTSQNWSDFGWRLGMRTPAVLLSLIENSTPFYIPNPVWESLVLEAPMAVMGWNEYSRQGTPVMLGPTAFLSGSRFDQSYLRIMYTGFPEATLTVIFPGKLTPDDMLACESGEVPANVHPEIFKLGCAAKKEKISHIELLPENSRPRKIKITFHRADKSSPMGLVFPQVDSRLEWMTDTIKTNAMPTGSRRILSPLSSCILNEITEQITSAGAKIGYARKNESISPCSDMTVEAKATDNLLLMPLGPQGYLLADYGLAQGVDDPLFWINSIADPGLLTQEWLDNLEGQLVPGAEKGLWRGVSIMRSVTTRVVAQYGISWLLGLAARNPQRPPAGNNQPQGCGGRTIPVNDYSDSRLTLHLSDLSGMEDGELGRTYPDTAPVASDRNVIVLIGGDRNSNSEVANKLIGHPEATVTGAVSHQDSLIRVYDDSRSNNIVVELKADYSRERNQMTASTYEALLDIRRMWINRANCFLGLFNTNTISRIYSLGESVRLLRDSSQPLPNIVGLMEGSLAPFVPEHRLSSLGGGLQSLFRSRDTFSNLLEYDDVREMLDGNRHQ